MTSPADAVTSAATVRGVTSLLRNCTRPSAKRNCAPTRWKLKISLLFVQLIRHMPGQLRPSGVKPWIGMELPGSAQPAPETFPLEALSLPHVSDWLGGPCPPATQ